MADEPKEPGKPPPATPRRPASKANWMAAKPAAKPSSRRLANVLALGALCLVLLGVLLAVLLWPNGFKKPRVDILSLSEYAEPLLPPAFAKKDADLLNEAFSIGSTKSTKRFDTQQGEAIQKLFKDLSQAKEKVLILYLRGLGRLDKGECYLLPAEARETVGSWLRLEDLLNTLAGSEDEKNSLVILDLASPKFDPFTGPADAEFGKVLHELAKKVNEASPHLHFLLAAGPDEASHVSEEWRNSVFAHYLARGLAGLADGSLDGSRNSRVSLPELARFVQQRVARWGDKHGLAQHPVLVGDRNFAVGEYRDVPAPEAPAVPPEADLEAKDKPAPPEFPYPKELRKLWQELEDGFRLRGEPPEWLRLRQRRALQAELLWRGGREVENALGKAPEEYVAPLPLLPAPPQSVAAMKPPESPMCDELKLFFQFCTRLKAGSDAEFRELMKQQAADLNKWFAAIQAKHRYGDVAWWVWAKLTDPNWELHWGRLKILHDLVYSFPLEPGQCHAVEILHLHKLALWLERYREKFSIPAAIAPLTLRVFGGIERILALPADLVPDALAKVTKEIGDFRRELVTLYVQANNPENADRCLATFARVASRLEEVRMEAEKVRRTRELRDRILWQVPGTISDIQLSPRDMGDREAAAKAVLELYRGSGGASETASDAWAALRKPFTLAELRKVNDRLVAPPRGSDVADILDLEARLRGLSLEADDWTPPPPPPKDTQALPAKPWGRIEAWQNVRKANRVHHNAVVELDAADEAAGHWPKALAVAAPASPAAAFPNGGFPKGIAFEEAPMNSSDFRSLPERQREQRAKARQLIGRHYYDDKLFYESDRQDAEIASCFNSLAGFFRKAD